MPAQVSFIPDEDRLDISFEGNLDVTVWQTVCDACTRPTLTLRVCIVDLTGVARVFDSGLAVLGLLFRRMRGLGATVVFLSDDLELRKRVAAFASPCWQRLSPTA